MYFFDRRILPSKRDSNDFVVPSYLTESTEVWFSSREFNSQDRSTVNGEIAGQVQRQKDAAGVTKQL